MNKQITFVATDSQIEYINQWCKTNQCSQAEALQQIIDKCQDSFTLNERDCNLKASKVNNSEAPNINTPSSNLEVSNVSISSFNLEVSKLINDLFTLNLSKLETSINNLVESKLNDFMFNLKTSNVNTSSSNLKTSNVNELIPSYPETSLKHKSGAAALDWGNPQHYKIPPIPDTWEECSHSPEWYFAAKYWKDNEKSAIPFISQPFANQQSCAETCAFLIWGDNAPQSPFDLDFLPLLKFLTTDPAIQEKCFSATGWKVPAQHIELPEVEEPPLTEEQTALYERIKKVAEKRECSMFEQWDLQHINDFLEPNIVERYGQNTTPLNLFVNIAVKDHLLTSEGMCRDLIKILRERYPLCKSWKLLEERAEDGSFAISDLCQTIITSEDADKPLPEISS